MRRCFQKNDQARAEEDLKQKKKKFRKEKFELKLKILCVELKNKTKILSREAEAAIDSFQ